MLSLRRGLITKSYLNYKFVNHLAVIPRNYSNDSKYFFSKPPANDNNDKGSYADSKHFFTKPNGKMNSNEQIDQMHNNGSNNPNNNKNGSTDSLIGQAILQQRRERRKQVWYALGISIFAVLIGYSIGYKVIYLNEDSFIPLYPSSGIRKPSQNDLRKIDVPHIKLISHLRVLEVLSHHDMIKEQYGVPLHDSNGVNPPQIKEFNIWCEDQDPCVTGLIIRKDDPNRPTTHTWHRIPYLLQWRVTHRPICISRSISNFLEDIGLSYSTIYEIISPEKIYGSFKYEYPIPGDDHSMHIWFLGELQLNNDTLIIYKGKYHVDVKLQQVDLLRNEDGKLVRYVLFKENE
ncbi:hypothetical protein Kpol_480p24 [Vanderwaltozyma polyspora DSM 70294]|uniref:Altered inheritance of mitochondria protein 39, mitochondrial n=1 Tax=Vanderwaltozyma polyspora (strain ATCC 22028 / DSM 70294 / BCRC 21397 / CBS 2163 / NBRC 10782 / NRRL Y-8283 / UCD 57-17) TaxID=436907 RepID=AIM39_VANPO|nr:uncharacterized protein Kpol_480p24 [Vanderwaltozyma polyspora DSM 70294]A7TP86.1 RecName: Full=Altered inheritance of mitochondria protein 39, mitochondrial; Flags: Precursor [Vanderwaltozyma polyspora DSM 70294]EDO15937.1 hypothetical protein Kpol_480p24 [Vanderwaltozyma polyspora DSM 70294]